MDERNLPLHVLERVERRWASVFSRQATANRPVTKPQSSPVDNGTGRPDLRLQRGNAETSGAASPVLPSAPACHWHERR
jgi:hypothetical protein